MREVWVDDVLIAFDGRVVEVFGHSTHPSYRFHVQNVVVEVGEPNRKGRRALQLDPASKYSGGCRLDVPAEDWPQVEPLVAEILAAMPD